MKIKGIDTTRNLSKGEEIKILESLQIAFDGTGNYLEALFSRDLVSHCAQQIMHDIAPDLCGELRHDNVKIEILRNMLSATVQQRDEAKSQIAVLQKLADARLEEIHKISRSAKRPTELLIKISEALTEAAELISSGAI